MCVNKTIPRQRRGVDREDVAVSLGRVGHHHNLAVGGRVGLQKLTHSLKGENTVRQAKQEREGEEDEEEEGERDT